MNNEELVFEIKNGISTTDNMQLLYESNLPLIKKFIKGEKDRIKKICSKEKESVCK